MKFKDEVDLLASIGMSEEAKALTDDSTVDTSEVAEVPAPYVPDNSPTGHSGLTTVTEDKAIALLGNGVLPSAVAAAVGVTPARISQLLSDKVIADKVAQLRYANLQKHTKRDNAYDSLEDLLLKKLKLALPLLHKPEAILKAVQVVNGAKRRGQQAPEAAGTQNVIANLVLPNVIVNKFSVDINNQVTKAGDQELLTMPSGNLLKQVEEAATAVTEALPKGVSHGSSRK